ncbi:hypothetical protein K8I85_06715, partial [bacterium]|nr:hypothetical protein [bacterium]
MSRSPGAQHAMAALAGGIAGAMLAPAALPAQTAGGYGDVTAWADWARRSLPGERAGLKSS